jgi:hypothetical protein
MLHLQRKTDEHRCGWKTHAAYRSLAEAESAASRLIASGVVTPDGVRLLFVDAERWRRAGDAEPALAPADAAAAIAGRAAAR